MRLRIALWLLKPILKSRKTRLALHRAMLKFYEETYYEDNAYNHLYNMANEFFEAHEVERMDLTAMKGGIAQELEETHKGVHFKVDIPIDMTNEKTRRDIEEFERITEMNEKAEKQDKFQM